MIKYLIYTNKSKMPVSTRSSLARRIQNIIERPRVTSNPDVFAAAIRFLVNNPEINKEGIIFPFYKTFFPGSGADYHYFGSIPFKKKGKLSVNNKCQLRSYNNIFILDGSVFDFKSNKYPLGIVAANARRVANLLSS